MNYPFNADSIPLALKSRKQWLMWRFEKPGNKITKVPYKPSSQAIKYGYAKANDPSTWSDFATCSQALTTGKFDGIGCAFTEGDGLTGIDLDHCYSGDGELKQLKPWAKEIIDQFRNTYIEESPSGDGLHIWCYGHPIQTGSQKWKEPGSEIEEGIEVYNFTSPRYFTVTGNAIAHREITDCQPGLEWLYQKYFAKKESPDKPEQVLNVNGELDIDVIQSALDCIPPDNYANWIAIGMALQAAGVDFQLWDDWSTRSPKYEPGMCARKWDTFKGNEIGLGTLFYIAKQHGFHFTNGDSASPPDWAKPETFGEPLLFGEIETPEINIDFLPSWVKNYVEAVAAHTQTPPGAVAMLALAILGTCVQKRFEVSPYQDDDSYTEPLSIWSLVILPPASRKTAILDALRSPVVGWERDKAVELQPEISKQITERNVMVSRIQELTKQAAKAEQLGEEDE